MRLLYSFLALTFSSFPIAPFAAAGNADFQAIPSSNISSGAPSCKPRESCGSYDPCVCCPQLCEALDQGGFEISPNENGRGVTVVPKSLPTASNAADPSSRLNN